MAPWLRAYQPAELGQHDRAFTTSEVLQMLERFNPGEYGTSELVELLENEGFGHELVGSDLRWLVRVR